MSSIETVGVAGCGLMGSGIAEVVARAGFDVVVREVDDGALEAGEGRIRESVDRAVADGKFDTEARDAAWDRISFTTDLQDLAGVDLALEAIVEDLEAKIALFRELDAVCGPGTLFATNTSSLTVTDIASETDRPGRMVGLHFFNPVPVMKLVEVVRTIATTDETFDAAYGFARDLGKEPIEARDTSGFVVNRLLVPFVLDAIRLLERGVASVEEIDRAMTLGTGHPMGPLTLSDFVGLDTLRRIAEIMHEEYREPRYAPPPLLKRMVSLGRHGKKSGRGFYDWSGDEPVPMEL